MVNDNQSNLDQDVVFSRLLDGRGRAADWQRLRDATAGEAGGAVWDQMIGSAGDQDLLGEVVAAAGDQAGTATLHPAGSEPLAKLPVAAAHGRRTDRAARSARLGWLVAACMALGLVSVSLRPTGGTGTQGANLTPFSLENLSSSDLMNGYKARAAKEGTLVGELPQRVVIETRPSADGKGYEVLYMRQFIERAIVDDLYKLGTDETGRPVMVPTSLQKAKPAGAM